MTKTIDQWLPIETLPEGKHVLLWFPTGERGDGGIEAATVYKDENGNFSFWTHGGPNSGLDWDSRDNEKPTHWMPLPSPPGAADEPAVTNQLIARARDILKGIDKTETQDREGWWETSSGAEFGAGKLAEIEALLQPDEPEKL